MTRALLADRFKLVVHNEDRPVAAYSLVAMKPKMKKADPLSRTRFQQIMGQGPTGSPQMTLTCQNMTMADFADRLQGIAPAYFHSPVLDATKIEGSWDFTLTFSPIGLFVGFGGRGGGGGGRGDGPPGGGGGANNGDAQDPSGGFTLFEAVEKEIGLKLEVQKRTLPVLVIDHVEQRPTEN